MSEKNEPDLNELGGILRKMREELSFKREHVAEHVNIGLRHLTAIELGEKSPSVATLRRLVRYYGASADRIFYPESYGQDGQEGQIEESRRLIAACTPKQRQLVTAFIRMLLDQTNLGL